MGERYKLFLECYAEVQRSFPGSTASVIRKMTERLCNSVRPLKSEWIMSDEEYLARCIELRTALQTIPNWPGLKPGERGINYAGE